MTRNELVSHVAEKANLTKTQATQAVDAVFDGIRDALSTGGEVRISNFGIFGVAERKGGSGRNPRTGEAITIRASKSSRFRPGKALKDALNVVTDAVSSGAKAVTGGGGSGSGAAGKGGKAGKRGR